MLISRLISPATNEIVELLDISEVDLPDIYVCPDNQYNLTMIREYGYSSRNLLLFGSPSKRLKKYSWGAHLNKTFDQVLIDVLPDISTNTDFNPKIYHETI